MTQKDLEMKAIAHICTFEDDIQMLLSEGIDEDFFLYNENGLLKNLFLASKNYYQKYNRLLSKEALEQKLKQRDNTASTNKMLSIFTQCLLMEIDHNSFPVLLEKMRNNKRLAAIQDVMHTIDDSVKNDQPEETLEKIRDTVMTAETIINKKLVGYDIVSVPEQVDKTWDVYQDKKKNQEKYKGIYIGLSPIDNITNGFKKSTLNIVVGASGSGKSTILLNWAAEVYKRGYNTLFFSFEMPLQQVMSRYISRETCVDYNRLYNGLLTEDEEERVREWKKDFRPQINSDTASIGKQDNLFGVITNYNRPPVDFVAEQIKMHMKKYGPIDAIFVDYLNNMTDREVLRSGGKNWEHPGRCANGLRYAIGAKYNIAVFTAQQINRSGLEKGRKSYKENPADYEANQEDLSGSQQAAYDADAIIGFAPDKLNHRVHFHLVKGRDFWFEPFVASYYPNICRIIDPIADNTSFLLSPIAARTNAAHQLGTDADGDLVEDFGDDF
jgi:GTPase SAR1 family protein